MAEALTSVVHVRSQAWLDAVAAGTAVYIGRHSPGFGRHAPLLPSPFGNPFKADVFYADGHRVEWTRDDVIRMYREWAAGTRRHPKGKAFPHALLESLRGKVLGCWCAPQTCHGDVLIELLEVAHAG